MTAFRANASRAEGGGGGCGSNLNGGTNGSPGGLEMACNGPGGKLQRFSGDLRFGRADDIEDRAVSGEGKIDPMLAGTAVPGVGALDFPSIDSGVVGTEEDGEEEEAVMELVFGVLELKSTPV